MSRTRSFATCAGALAAALLGAPALAQGFAPAPATGEVDWTGPYVGAQLGWGWTGGEAEIEVDGSTYDADVDGSGVAGGLTVGYRFDLGSTVLGAEAQFDWSSTYYEDPEVEGLADDPDDAGRLKDMWRVKGLAGYDLGRTLVYGSLGWARATIETPNDIFDGSGWTVGAGADYMLTDRLTVGGEITYHTFDDVGSGSESFDIDATRIQAKATLRF